MAVGALAGSTANVSRARIKKVSNRFVYVFVAGQSFIKLGVVWKTRGGRRQNICAYTKANPPKLSPFEMFGFCHRRELKTFGVDFVANLVYLTAKSYYT